jgi:hypothetical protein
MEIEKIAKDLISFYKEIYQKKFLIASDEVFDEENILTRIKSVSRYIKEEKELVGIFKKAIFWYIYMHDTTSANGNKYPYKLNLFFGQSWLFQKCIESSNEFNIDDLENFIASGMNIKQYSKAAQRGDVIRPNKNSEDIREKALKLFYKFELQLEKDGNDDSISILRKNKKISEIFKSSPPSVEYCENAIQLLNSLMGEYVSKNF